MDLSKASLAELSARNKQLEQKAQEIAKEKFILGEEISKRQDKVRKIKDLAKMSPEQIDAAIAQL